MLGRSLFEHMIDAHWAIKNPQAASRNYREYADLSRVLLAEKARQHPDVFDAPPGHGASPATVKALKKRYGRFGERGWTRTNLHDRVTDVESMWPSKDGRKTLRFHYDIAVWFENQFLHPSPFSLERAFEDVRDVTGGVEIEYARGLERSSEWIHRSLIEAYWSYMQLVALVIDEFQIGSKRDWERKMNAIFDAGFGSRARAGAPGRRGRFWHALRGWFRRHLPGARPSSGP
jgi:hypothetical protein